MAEINDIKVNLITYLKKMKCDLKSKKQQMKSKHAATVICRGIDVCCWMMASLVNIQFDSTWEEGGTEGPTGQGRIKAAYGTYTEMVLECVQYVMPLSQTWDWL
jgi:hypothetical protein